MKKCNKCKITKIPDAFHRDRQRLDGRSYTCKMCINPIKSKLSGARRQRSPEQIRNARLRYDFGIDLPTYNKMFAKQRGKCSICKQHQRTQRRFLDVDHCHKTGKIRGLLCGRCNKAIGLLKENVTFIKNALRYLVKSE